MDYHYNNDTLIVKNGWRVIIFYKLKLIREIEKHSEALKAVKIEKLF